MSDSAKNINKIISILDADLCLGIDDLAKLTELSNRVISKAATQLIYRGLVERVEKGCYQLTHDGLIHKNSGKLLKAGPVRDHFTVAKPRRQALRTRLWRSMRRLTKFTISDLLEIACDGDEKNPINNAQRYIKGLADAGYLIEMKVKAASTKPTSNGFKRYLLLRDTGHMPPALRKKAANQNEVYDRNLKEVFVCHTSRN